MASTISTSADEFSVGQGPGRTSLADQIVCSALRYRSHAPIIDAFQKEVGMSATEAAS